LPEFNLSNIQANLEGVVEYEKPNSNLYEFVGKLVVNNQELYVLLFIRRFKFKFNQAFSIKSDCK
jgi:hypothetical protein